MELITKEPRSLKFHGSGGALFGILIVNFLLTLITLGFYYPWAKAKRLKYLYAETELDNSRFSFHGTGTEMFKGFIKAIGIIIVVYGVLFLSALTKNMVITIVGFLFFMFAFFLLGPLAIHGSLRYRMSRTSWRSIHFGYRGDRKELIVLYLKGIFLTIITLYIYLAWFICDLRKYIIGNIRFGSISFKYYGKGGDLFIINLKGFFLTILTLGIYGLWWARDMMRFYINNIKIVKNEQEYNINFNAKVGDIFVLFLVNYFLVILTLGIAIPWVMVRNIKFIYENSMIDGEFDTSNIQQTEEDYKDATGEDMLDMLDLNII
jgi:uncharacterized membrane protein YjgN (DUF898 family)